MKAWDDTLKVTRSEVNKELTAKADEAQRTTADTARTALANTVLKFAQNNRQIDIPQLFHKIEHWFEYDLSGYASVSTGSKFDMAGTHINVATTGKTEGEWFQTITRSIPMLWDCAHIRDSIAEVAELRSTTDYYFWVLQRLYAANVDVHVDTIKTVVEPMFESESQLQRLLAGTDALKAMIRIMLFAIMLNVVWSRVEGTIPAADALYTGAVDTFQRCINDRKQFGRARELWKNRGLLEQLTTGSAFDRFNAMIQCLVYLRDQGILMKEIEPDSTPIKDDWHSFVNSRLAEKQRPSPVANKDNKRLDGGKQQTNNYSWRDHREFNRTCSQCGSTVFGRVRNCVQCNTIVPGAAENATFQKGIGKGAQRFDNEEEFKNAIKNRNSKGQGNTKDNKGKGKRGKSGKHGKGKNNYNDRRRKSRPRRRDSRRKRRHNSRSDRRPNPEQSQMQQSISMLKSINEDDLTESVKTSLADTIAKITKQSKKK